MSEYYLLRAGESETSGPYPESRILAEAEAGRLMRGDFLFQEGWPDWRTVSQVFPVEAAAPNASVASSETPARATVDPRFSAPYLLDGEIVIFIGEQSRIAAKTVVPDAVVITDRRLLIIRRGVISKDVSAAYWREVLDTQLKEGLLFSSLVFNLCGTSFQVEHLPKGTARELFSLAQGLEKERVFVR